MALIDASIRQAKAGESNYKIADGKGLYLLLTPSGSKLWKLKCRIDGKERSRPWVAIPSLA
ncbi:MAG: Arm DNA-binding domain-containing protein [Novosphingobium sp.]